jgi:hypothetical protein
MATYVELAGLLDNDDLRKRVAVALLVKAQAYLDAGGATAAQRTWARNALNQPAPESNLMLRYLLAKNNGLTVAQINGVADATLQSQVDAVAAAYVNAFVGA